MGKTIQVFVDGRMVADEVIFADTPQLRKSERKEFWGRKT